MQLYLTVLAVCFLLSLAEAVGRYGEGNWKDILNDPEYAEVVSIFIRFKFLLLISLQHDEGAILFKLCADKRFLFKL